MRYERIKRRIERNFKKIDMMRSARLDLPFVQFVSLMPYMTMDTIKSLALVKPPKVYHKHTIPENLQFVTYGTLVSLQNAAKTNDYLLTCCSLVSVLTGMHPDRVASTKARDVLGIVNMVQSEMERIGKLFASLDTDHTSEERSAGIERLNFGPFGIADWYAKRMGIVDHEEVFATPWARIYQCLKIDHEDNEFKRKYLKIMEGKK